MKKSWNLSIVLLRMRGTEWSYLALLEVDGLHLHPKSHAGLAGQGSFHVNSFPTAWIAELLVIKIRCTRSNFIVSRAILRMICETYTEAWKLTTTHTRSLNWNWDMVSFNRRLRGSYLLPRNPKYCPPPCAGATCKVITSRCLLYAPPSAIPGSRRMPAPIISGFITVTIITNIYNNASIQNQYCRQYCIHFLKPAMCFTIVSRKQYLKKCTQ